MTRLKETDLEFIPSRLSEHNESLRVSTGGGLFDIACHAYNIEASSLREKIRDFSIQVIPVTAGQGIISGFSATVASILSYLGFPVQITKSSDVAGLAEAVSTNADGVFMADDHKFIAINLQKQLVVDNSIATGQAFAAALNLMARGLKEKKVLVLGCGAVGAAATASILSYGGIVNLYDTKVEKAEELHRWLTKEHETHRFLDNKVTFLRTLEGAGSYEYILEASSSSNTIPKSLINMKTCIAAPGVPLGVTESQLHQMQDKVIHDTLELGVASMAVGLLVDSIKGD